MKQPRVLRALAVAPLLACLALAACSGGREDRFAACGNGRMDSGEQCDNGGNCVPPRSGPVPRVDEYRCLGGDRNGEPCDPTSQPPQCGFGVCRGPSCTSDSECGGESRCSLFDDQPCLSTCVFARCGDEFVNRAAEECDGQIDTLVGLGLDGRTCQSFGLGAGRLFCSSACKFDSSGCGAPFTPTGTATQTPTVTQTLPPSTTPTATSTRTPSPVPTGTPTVGGTIPPATSTPTATNTRTVKPSPTIPANCGNGCRELDLGETCDNGGICRGGSGDGQPCNENIQGGCNNNPCPGNGTCVPVESNVVNGDTCPANCRIAACQTDGTTVDIDVTFVPPAGTEVSSLIVFLRYPDGVVFIPGSFNSPLVEERISVPSGANFTPNDLDYAMQILFFSLEGPIPPPDLFSVQFERCQSATEVTSGLFSCQVLDVPGVTCSVTVR